MTDQSVQNRIAELERQIAALPIGSVGKKTVKRGFLQTVLIAESLVIQASHQCYLSCGHVLSGQSSPPDRAS